MTDLALAMASILITWAILLPAFIGLGLVVRRLWGWQARKLDGEEALLSFWIGVAASMAVLQLWNFFWPVTWHVTALFLLLGMIGLIVNGGALRHWIATSARGSLATIAAAALIAVWLANRSIGPANADDSGLYHFSAIMWANEYAVVPGLGNLAATLALNNASFLYTAMLNVGPWEGRVEHIANGLLLLGLWLHVITSFGTWHFGSNDHNHDAAAHNPKSKIENPKSAAPRRLPPAAIHENRKTAAVMGMLMLVPAVMLAIAKDVSSPKTDLPAGVFVVISAYWLLRIALGPGGERDRRPDRLLSLAMLCAAAVCIKLSMIVVAGLIGVVAAWLWWRQRADVPKPLAPTLSTCALVVAIFIAPWIARSMILSGYPLYPSKALAMNVEWRVPEPAIDYLQGAIRNHAKGGMQLWLHEVIKGSRLSWYAPLIKPPFDDRDKVRGINWVRSWLFALPLSSPIEILLPLAVAACGIAALIQTSKRQNVKTSKQPFETVGEPSVWTFGRLDVWTFFALIMPFIAALIFWVWAGPDARYGWPAAWTLAGVIVAMAVARRGVPTYRARQKLTALVLLMLIPVIGYRAVVHKMLGRAGGMHEVVVLGPGADRGFHPRPYVPVKPIVNRWGVTIYVPAGEDQFHCWKGPLPCSGWPPLDSDLRLRRDGDLQSGFVIDRSPAQSRAR